METNKKLKYRVWEYRKGFSQNNKMYYGITAMLLYTIGFIKYVWKK